WDISDVLNMQGSGARPPGSVFLYVKHDSNNVYWALDFVAKATREDYDQFGCYLDENYNRVWTTDSSEGNHWFVWLTRDTVVYRALIGTGNIPSAYWTRWLTGNGISRASTASGHLQFEAVVAKGTQKWNYTINPEEDTVGFYVYVSAAPGSVYWGTWPTTMPGANWNNAATYGTLIFSRQQVEIKEGKGITKTEIKINNPLRMPLILKGVKGLSIYDATGKVVKEINEAKDGNLVWDGKDRNGNSISNGIYFLKMKLDNGSQTTKAIILR
ncbi:MAG: FlgD immunoglobulin-like domain containing protein, partial [candidate division WOR-3 bacterium]